VKEKEENSIKNTLSVLDEMKPVETDAFFYSRLQARMENFNIEKHSWISRKQMILQPLIVGILIIVNILIFTYRTDKSLDQTADKSNDSEKIVADRNNEINAFAQEYSITINTNAYEN
jgi:hypothetical protein